MLSDALKFPPSHVVGAGAGKSPAGAAPPLKSFFEITLDSGSQIHQSKAEPDKLYLREYLIVYVHGIFSDNRKTWGCTHEGPGGVPEYIRDRVGVDADVLNFYWPSKFPECADIKRAALVLQNLLFKSTEFRHYRSLIFVGHSAGGLVVRQMLCNDAGEALKRYREALGQSTPNGIVGINSILFRTRAVVDLSVPHSGGRLLTSRIGLGLYILVYALFLVIPFGIVRTVTQGRRYWGFNRLALQLQRANKWLRELRGEYLAFRDECKQLGLPFPARLLITGERDTVVLEEEPGDARHIRVDSNHSGVKELLNAGVKGGTGGGPTGLSELVSVIQHYIVDPAAHLAQRTVERVIELDMLRGIKGLARVEESQSHTPPAGARPQLDAMNAVMVELESGRVGHIVLVGPAGVGKSLVVRTISRHIALLFLTPDPRKESRDPHSSLPLPIGYALQGVQLTIGELNQIYLDPQQVGEQLLRTVLSRWCQWVNSQISYSNTVKIDWLWDRISRGRVTIVLDAIDEFVAMHPRISHRDIRRMVEFVQVKPGTRIVFAFRSSLTTQTQFGNTAAYPLVLDADRLVVVALLTKAQAGTMFPALIAELGASVAPDNKLWNLLLTPLVLYYLDKVRDRITPADLASRTAILELTLQGLLLATLPTASHADLPLWADALTIVTWAGFMQAKPDLAKLTILEEVRNREDAWTVFMQTRDSNAEWENLQRSFRLAQDVGNWETFVRIMFYPTGPDSVRVMHQIWSDLLTARYIRICFGQGFFAELGKRAFNRPMARDAADLLVRSQFEITPSTVGEMLKGATLAAGQFARGNFCAVIASGVVPITRPAITKLFGDLPNMEPVARLVVFNGIGARSIFEAVPDISRNDLRRELAIIYRELLLASGTGDDWRSDAVLASLSRAYLLAYREPIPEGANGKGLSDSPGVVSRALSLISDVTITPPATTPPYESLQSSFVTLVDDLKSPLRAINALHYLFYLVCAKVRGLQIREVDDLLERVFETDPGNAQAVTATKIDYLSQIFEMMRQMWKPVA